MKQLKTAEECAAAIAAIGETDRELGKIQSDLDTAVTEAKEKAEEKAQPLDTQRAELVAQVEAYCTKHRDALTDNGKRKFAEFTSGKAGWQLGRPQLEVDPKKKDAIIKDLNSRKATRKFLRITISLDQRAILKEPDAFKGVKGLKFRKATESFYIEPVKQDLAGKQEVAAKG